MKCNCCFCLNCSQKLGDHISYPFALLFYHEGFYKSAWITSESSKCPSIYTPIKNYFTLKEAQLDLKIKEWIMKFRLNDEIIYLPLQYVISLNFVQRQMDCPGEVSICSNKNIKVFDIQKELEFCDNSFISNTVQRKFITLQQNKRKYSALDNISINDVSNINNLPFRYWNQSLFNQYFSKDREVANDPTLNKIIGIQYHSIGTSMYECEWEHPSGKTFVSFHRGGQLQTNKNYMKQMIEIKKKIPDKSFTIDKFD